MKKAFGIFTLLLVVAGFGIFLASCVKDHTPQLSYQAQLQKDTTFISQYLADNHIVAKKDTSGLYYVINTLGTGVKPTLYSVVVGQLLGKILNTGQVYDVDTIPITSQVTNFKLKCFIYGFQLVPKGSKFTLYIPSGLAFGAGGSFDGTVPPNTNLIYNITSIDNDAQLVKDVATIDTYLANNNITAIQDQSGLRYVIVDGGTGGPMANTSSIVTVTYTGTFLGANKAFTMVSNQTQYPMNSIIQGWQIGLIHVLPPDGHIILYIPSGLAYGAGGSADGTVPRNENLLFDIKLFGVN